MFDTMFLVVGGALLWHRATRHNLAGWVWVLLLMVGMAFFELVGSTVHPIIFFIGVVIMFLGLFFAIPFLARPDSREQEFRLKSLLTVHLSDPHILADNDSSGVQESSDSTR